MAQQLSDTHYDIAYNAVIKKELDKDEIKDLCVELNEGDEYDRNENSAEFLLSRMHILVHGIAPHGETQNRAETMFNICDKMIDYANRKGLDTMFNIELAKVDLADRPIRVKYEVAKSIVSEYYFSLSPEDRPVAVNRDDVIAQVMEGTPVEEALAA
jgi:hypothetical protein